MRNEIYKCSSSFLQGYQWQCLQELGLVGGLKRSLSARFSQYLEPGKKTANQAELAGNRTGEVTCHDLQFY